MKIIVGLGNPGKEYEGTRHNVGYRVLDALREDLHFPEFQKKPKFDADVSEGECDSEKVILVKPLTFMNKSGDAILAAKQFYKVGLKDLLVVYDDYDLPIGQMRYREEGGPGTHNGMKSCVERLGTQSFPRLRIGINAGVSVKDLSNYVLGSFTDSEIVEIKPAIMEALVGIKKILAISGESK